MNSKQTRVRAGLFAVLLLAAILVMMLLAPSRAPVHEAVLPDCDGWGAYMLDFSDGQLKEPDVARTASREEIHAAMAETGDVAYDDDQGGGLYVVSGRHAVVDRRVALRDLAPAIGELEEKGSSVLWLRDMEGKLALVKSMRGRHVLVVAKPADRKRIRLRWLVLGQDRTRLTKAELDDLLGPPVGPVAKHEERGEKHEDREKGIRSGSATVTAMHAKGANGFSFATLSNVEFPEKGEGPNARRAFYAFIRANTDIAYDYRGAPMLQISSRRSVLLEGIDLRGFLTTGIGAAIRTGGAPATANVSPGKLYGLRTLGGKYACIRLRAVTEERLVFDWVLRRDGADVFPPREAIPEEWLAEGAGHATRAVDIEEILYAKTLSLDDKKKAIDRAVAAGADLNTKDARGNALLHRVAMDCRTDLVDILLAAGVDANAKNDFGWSALHIAAKLGLPDMCRLLIKRGADPAIATEQGVTPLQLALMSRRKKEETLQVLRSVKRELTLREAIALGDVTGVKRALARGADVNGLDGEGRTPLHLAAEKGHAQVCELLVSAGASPERNAAGGQKYSAIALAALKGHVSVLNVFLDPAKPPSGDVLSRALEAAVQYVQPESCRVLLEAGASAMGEPLKQALAYSPKPIVDLFASHGASVPLWAAARIGDLGRCKALLEAGGDIDAIGANGMTALLHATAQGHEEVAALLLGRGADVEAVRAHDRSSALHLAAEKGDLDTARLLIQSGAKVNATNGGGRTPLYESVVVNKSVEMARLLLVNGADPNIVPVLKTKDGEKRYSILKPARRTPELLRLLKKHGAK